MHVKKKNILVDRFALYFWFFGLLFTIFLNALILIEFSKNAYNLTKTIVQICLHLYTFIVSILTAFFVNRSSNFVCYYPNGTLERRGFLFGFKKIVIIKKISKIEKVSLHLDGTYYVLLDGKSYCLSRLKKDSAIFIPFTKKGYDFIKTFWEGEIPYYNS